MRLECRLVLFSSCCGLVPAQEPGFPSGPHRPHAGGAQHQRGQTWSGAACSQTWKGVWFQDKDRDEVHVTGDSSQKMFPHRKLDPIDSFSKSAAQAHVLVIIIRIKRSTMPWEKNDVLMCCSYRASLKGVLENEDSIQTCRVLQSCRAEEFLTLTILRNTATSCRTTALTVLPGVHFGLAL